MSRCFYLKHDVSETGFCLRLQVELTQLGPIDRIKTGRWIMSRNTTVVLIYHRHKLLDLIYIKIIKPEHIRKDMRLRVWRMNAKFWEEDVDHKVQ
jgi:hypothetical protein